jgi:hypothetical protein
MALASAPIRQRALGLAGYFRALDAMSGDNFSLLDRTKTSVGIFENQP